jgi:Domain of unknown function (DUF5666)
MKIRLASALVFGFAFIACAAAQTPASSNAPVPPDQGQPQGQSQVQGGGPGQRGQRGFGGGPGQGMIGRGLSGTVTEAAADHFTVKSFTGDIYTIKFTAETRMTKQPAGQRGTGGAPGFNRGAGQGQAEGGGQQGGNGAQGQAQGRRFGGNPAQQIKATDIKVGDAITAVGDVDSTAKSVSATLIMQLDPERAKQMQDMEASYGKSWLMGKVTAVDGVKVTLTGSVDNAPHSFLADENTTFRRRRDPITLADIQVGDTIRADGAVKDGVFTAATVTAMGGAAGENPAGPPPGSAPPQ